MCYWLGWYEIFQNVVLFITGVNGTMWLSSLGMGIITLYLSPVIGRCWSEVYQIVALTPMYKILQNRRTICYWNEKILNG
jgi:hypothetical protein